MKNENFVYSITTSKKPEAVFQLLKNIDQWWSGLFDETIEGTSQQLGDEFTFHAGGGAHYSKQQLIELIPGKRIAWLVTDSKLTFTDFPTEWTGTKIRFDIAAENDQTKVTFTHDGLIPQFACYTGCSRGWTNYLQKLDQKLNEA